MINGQTSDSGSDTQEFLNQPNVRGEYSYIVFFDEPSMLDEQVLRRKSRMSPQERRSYRYDPLDLETLEYQKDLEVVQSEHIASIEEELNRDIRVSRRFIHATNQIYTWLCPEEAERVAQLPGISKVAREPPPMRPDSS